jgi:hypothetical protein
MAVERTGLTVKKAVQLLENQEFLQDSRAYWDHYRAHSKNIGNDLQEWERQAPAFMNTYLDPFVKKWRGAYPATEELLSTPLYQETNAAQMSGRWGVIPVYPWTTEKETKTKLKQVQRVIGKKYIDFGTIRRAQIANWLDENFRSTRTGAPPMRSETAAIVWGRRKGLNRQSKEEAIAGLPEEREGELLARYLRKGMTRSQAERQVYKSARGSESPASAMVRMALQRQRARKLEAKKLSIDPARTEKVGLAITLLLRELPTSKSSPSNLEAIRLRAVELGNILLPPESSMQTAN